MKPIFSTTLLFILSSILFCPAWAAQDTSSATPYSPSKPKVQTLNRMVAIVGDDAVLQSELYQGVFSIQQQYKSQADKLPPFHVLEEQVLNRLIITKLQVQRAHEQGIRVSQSDIHQAIVQIANDHDLNVDQLHANVINEGGNWSAFQKNISNQVTVQRLRNQIVRERVHITDSEVNNLVNNPSFNAGKVHLLHIRINIPNGAGPEQIKQAGTKAQKAIKAINQGMDFNTAAIRFSNAADALEGGDLGWLGMNEVPPAFVNTIETLKPGQVSKPLRGPGAFHILKLVDRKTHHRSVVTQYHLRRILIKTDALTSAKQARQKAQTIYHQLTAQHKSFATLAKANSNDMATANIGGDLGWVGMKSLPPLEQKALATLSKSTVSKPIQTQQGWVILKLVDQKQADMTEQAEKHRARVAIGNRKAKQVYNDFLRQLRSGAYIKILIPSLSHLQNNNEDTEHS